MSTAAVEAMKPGSVIVDLAAEAGGNCELTVADRIVTSPNGVTIVGTTNLPSTMPNHASQLLLAQRVRVALPLAQRRRTDRRHERRRRQRRVRCCQR